MSGVVNSQTVTLDANGRWVGNNANFLFLITASLPVTVAVSRTLQDAGTETFSNIQAGLKIARVRRFDQALITGTPGATVTLFFGYQQVREDETAFNQQIATIAGTVAVAILPSSTVTDTADTAQAVNTQTAISANLSRRRITIGVPPLATEAVRVSKSGGAGRGVVIQPGTNQEFQTTDALVVRNDNTLGSGGGTTWYAEEET